MVRRLCDAYLALEGFWFLVQVTLGLGCIAYVGASWLLYWLQEGRYMLALCAAISASLLTVAAIGRIPIALTILFGVSVMLGVLFTSGNGSAVP